MISKVSQEEPKPRVFEFPSHEDFRWFKFVSAPYNQGSTNSFTAVCIHYIHEVAVAEWLVLWTRTNSTNPGSNPDRNFWKIWLHRSFVVYQPIKKLVEVLNKLL